MELNKYIDHTALKPDTTIADIERLCKEAVEHDFAAVCVSPVYVNRALNLLNGSNVELATVVGFPLGTATSSIKVREAWEALQQGATEIDMVMSVGLFKSGDYANTKNEIEEVVLVCEKRPVKVILETSLLKPDEISKASKLAADAGAAYVKTSTGFGSRGATVADIELMKAAVGDRCKIKASGGIRNREQTMAMIDAGASRIGTSAGVAIVEGK